MELNKIINKSYNLCISGQMPDIEMMTKMFEADPKARETLYLRECAYRAALLTTGGSAFLWKKLQLECAYLIKFECRAYTEHELVSTLLNVLQGHKNIPYIVLDFADCRGEKFFSSERIAQITAVSRLVSGKQTRNICVAPGTNKAFISGANAAVINDSYRYSDLNDENIETMMFKAGYKVKKEKEIL